VRNPLKRPKRLAKREVIERNKVLDPLYNDFYHRRSRVYRINFVRGIFFGVGTIIGGTIVIAILVALLTLLIDIPGGLGEFIRWVVDTIQYR